MKIIPLLQQRIEAIGSEVMKLVENQAISLTEKNRLMKPLVDEKKVLEETVSKLNTIGTTDYSGRCHG